MDIPLIAENTDPFMYDENGNPRVEIIYTEYAEILKLSFVEDWFLMKSLCLYKNNVNGIAAIFDDYMSDAIEDVFIPFWIRH